MAGDHDKPKIPDHLDADSDRFLETGGASRLKLSKDLMADLTPGTRLGAYVIDDELGQGGMAHVYRAHRADGQFEQKVAIKVMDRLSGGSAAIVRFEQERQILAALSHPNIAGLIDGGQTESGLPYLVMEAVEGVPIDQYCDDHRLDVAARIRLLLRVIRALEYAHSRLVVHRDIKPANILVDGAGLPRLLDFGIAKILAESDLTTTAETQAGVRLLTLELAAPEQFRSEPVGIATDVYQLGALLYRLLTGRYPFELAGLNIRQIEDRVCKHPPDPPSSCLARLEEDRLVKAAGERSMPTADLRRELKGDLDAIVLKCLKKEPDQRYASASRLADDLVAFLEGHPVSAQRDHAGYRLRKFVQRHLALVWASGISLLLIIGLTSTYVWQIKAEQEIARREAQHAAAVSDYLKGVFRDANPSRFGGEPPTVLDLLTRGADRLHESLAEYPQARYEIAAMMGSALNTHGATEQTIEMIRPMIARVGMPGTPDELDLYTMYAFALAGQGEDDEAIEILRTVRTASRQITDFDPMPVARTGQALAVALWQKGRREEAIQVMEPARDTYLATYGPDHLQYARFLINYGLIHIGLDNARATELFIDAERIVLEQSGPEDSLLVMIYGNLAPIMISPGTLDRALEYADKSFAISKIHYPNSPAQIAIALGWKGRALMELERYREATDALLQARRMVLEQHPDGHPTTNGYDLWLTQIALAEDDCETALSWFRPALRDALVPGMVGDEVMSEVEVAVAACR